MPFAYSLLPIGWGHIARRSRFCATTDGRAGIFDDYRLRVATVVRDYGLNERDQAPPFHAGVERRVRSCPVLPPVGL